MPLFGRKKEGDEPIDPEARSPELGIKYKDVALLGQLLQQGFGLHQPRHALYYLYFAFQGIAGRLGGEFDGWEAAARP